MIRGEMDMAHTLAAVCEWSHGTWHALDRWRHRVPALLVTAITLLGAHGVAAAGDLEPESSRVERTRVVAQLQATSEAELRRHYLHCAHASNARLLMPDESVLCVLVADVLLQRAFAGDFAALVAWYQQHREPAAAPNRR